MTIDQQICNNSRVQRSKRLMSPCNEHKLCGTAHCFSFWVNHRFLYQQHNFDVNFFNQWFSFSRSGVSCSVGKNMSRQGDMVALKTPNTSCEDRKASRANVTRRELWKVTFCWTKPIRNLPTKYTTQGSNSSWSKSSELSSGRTYLIRNWPWLVVQLTRLSACSVVVVLVSGLVSK